MYHLILEARAKTIKALILKIGFNLKDHLYNFNYKVRHI